jgi:dTDP-4-dehydrorhamnose reductase
LSCALCKKTKLRLKQIKQTFMKILITGANGMVAQASIKHCRQIGDTISAYARQDLDISDRDAVFSVIERELPDAIINCAAYTDVDGAETNQEKCFAANSIGVENLALAAKED